MGSRLHVPEPPDEGCLGGLAGPGQERQGEGRAWAVVYGIGERIASRIEDQTRVKEVSGAQLNVH